MTKFGLVLPLWDHADAAGNLLERAVGEVGIDYVVIPAVTGAVAAFRPHWFPDAPTFHSEGGWHFPPTAKLYAPSGVKPHRARWTAQRDVLRGALDAAAAARVAVFFAVDLQQIPALLEDHPHLAQRNAWGEDAPPRVACLMNPATRELLRLTLQDLERFAPAGYVLPALSLDSLHVSRALDHGCVAGICFCPACRAAAEQLGLDADGAARSVRVLRTRHFEHPLEQIQAAETDDALCAYRRVRLTAALTWLDRLREEFTAREFLFDDRVLNIDKPAYLQRRVILQRTGRKLYADQPTTGITRVALDARTRPWAVDQPELVREFSEATHLAADYIDMSDVAIVEPQFIDRWRQAVRYARREAAP